MAFKLRNSYKMDNTPIFERDIEDGILGMALNTGGIIINKNVSPLELKKNKTISHEKVHLEQMKRGDLGYTDKDVYWKGKRYPRSKMNEGAKNLPWEKEAYKKQ